MAGSKKDKPSKILLLTSSEYGQANVYIAVVYELLLQGQHDVHVASFSHLKGRMEELNKLVSGVSKSSSQATFHTITGPSINDCLLAKGEFVGPFAPGASGVVNTFSITLPALATAFDEEQYVAGYESCLEIIRSVQPDVLVVEPLLNQALDACQTLGKTCVVLSPNTFRDVLIKQQPVFSQLARYPIVGSAYPYPVPWPLVLVNVYLKIRTIFILLLHAKVKALVKYRKARSLSPLPPVFNIWQEKNHYIVPSVPETDFPCRLTPNITPCGPILVPQPPVVESDPALYEWLKKGPTVLINLGSHIRMSDKMARAFTSALKVLLDSRPDVQVLWKLKRKGGIIIQEGVLSTTPKMQSEVESVHVDVTDASLEAIKDEISAGRVRIEEWMSADPVAVLQTGFVVCAVHHGGSNSFHEALSAGVPQIVLPCWLDTFDFANRAEYLGIGIYGSRTSAPRVNAEELTSALMKVLDGGKEATQMSERAKELALVATKAGGRSKAAEAIIEYMESL